MGVVKMWTQLPSPEEMAAWPPPNYVDPVTRRPLVLGVEIPLLLLVVLFNYMRFHSEFFISYAHLTWEANNLDASLTPPQVDIS